MANSDLKDKYFKVPDKVFNRVNRMLTNIKTNDGHAKGLARAKDLIDDRRVSYAQMKRIKNYFDNYKGDGSDNEYKLIGGDITKDWVNKTLNLSRETIKHGKQVRKDGGMENQFIRTHEKDYDNSNPTKSNGGMIDIGKSSTMKNIMADDAIYQENYNKEINTIKYLMEYLNKT